MAVTQYIGARYVPIFAEPLEWDITKEYEPLTIVYYQGNSYTSRQAVPTNVNITDTNYWALTGNYNAQIEQYRQEVQTFDDRISANEDNIEKLEGKYLGIIGDSFSDASTEWPSIVASKTGYTLINKAVSRSSFSDYAQGTNFTTQLENLANDANFKKCKTIIVYGGVNDFRAHHATISQMQSAFINFFNVYNSLTHKPRLIFAFGNLGKARQAEYNQYAEWYKGCLQALKDMNAPGVVEYVSCWLFETDNTSFGTDNLHPNTSGHKIIAEYMMQLLNGTYTGVHFTNIYRETNESGLYRTKNTWVDFNNGVLTFGALVRIDESQATASSSWTNMGVGSNASAYTFGYQANEYNNMPEAVNFPSNAHYIMTNMSTFYRMNNFNFNRCNGNFYDNKVFSSVPETESLFTYIGNASIPAF